jgi:Trypsin-like peptidase domain/NB-ARC domain
LQRVEDLLRAAVVRIEGGPRPGTGFLLAPGRVVTCVHVVGRDAALRLHLDDGTTLPARRVLLACDGGRPIPALDEDYPDVAVLEVDLDGHVCVMLDRDRPAIGDGLQAYGYPSEGDSVLLTPQGLRYEGVKGPEATPFVDVSSTAPIKPGMSGAPLLNVRTGTVCGVLVATRSATSTRGGLAVGWSALGETISSRLLGANRSFHLRDDRWSRALGDRRTRTFFGRVPTVARFTGRGAELETLSRRLAAAGTEPFRQAITGLGGVGKTQLAAQYVHSHRDDYDIVAWVRAQDAGVADLAALAATLGLAVGDLGTEARAERALSWLECCDERWLLVLDDVSDPEQLETCCPSGGNGRVLITSRHRDFEHLGPALAIDVFDDATGAEYLIERTGRRGERKTAVALSRALGGLPLALAHAAAYCTREVSFEEYRQMLIALPPRKLFHRSRAEFYRQTVASTWQPSIDAAAGEAPLARDVLAMAAHLAPDRIPRTLFNELLDDREGPLGNMQLADALAALDRYSLADLGKATLSVPRLLQHVVLNDSVDAQRRREAGHAALQAVSEAMPSDSALPDAWPQGEKLLPHVLAIGESLSLTGEQPSRLLGLLNRGCGYLLDAGQRRRAVDVARRNVVIAHDLLGGEHPDTLRTELQLADALQWEDSTPEALRLARRVLEDCKRLLGDAHRITISRGRKSPFPANGRATSTRRYGSESRSSESVPSSASARSMSSR